MYDRNPQTGNIEGSLKRTRPPIGAGDRKRSPFDRSRIVINIINSSLRIKWLRNSLILNSFCAPSPIAP